MTSFYILNNRTRKKDLESCDGLGNIDGKVSFLRGFFCKQLFSMAESIDSKIMLWLFLRKNKASCIHEKKTFLPQRKLRIYIPK